MTPREPRALRLEVERLPLSLTPLEAFERLGCEDHTLFLDSAERDSPLGRYSYLAVEPRETIHARAGTLVHRERGSAGARTIAHDDPLDFLSERLARYTVDRRSDLPLFQGGAAGVFSYDLGQTIERLPTARFDEFETPWLAVGLYDRILAWDHEREEAWLFWLATAEERDRQAAAVRSLVERLDAPPSPQPDRNPARLDAALLAPGAPVPGGAPELRSNFSPEAYIEAVARAIEYIRAGDIFQVNLSQRLLHPAPADPLAFYRRLRRENAAPYGAWFRAGAHIIASSSPEQFLSLRSGRVSTRPIKGTRGRGYTPEEDGYRRLDLAGSPKDRSENVMIVDLLRNDLSRVARPGSVKVPRLFELERHPTVHHLVSEVVGELEAGVSAVDLLRATFPGGSITGAPKVRAMEIIAELEPTARGAYCGSLGWLAFHGDLETSILIRTATIAWGWMQIPVGGGIVADSVPLDEYRETLAKAKGMLRAI